MTIAVSILDGPLADGVTVRIDGAGAVVQFDGVVRPIEGGKDIAGLAYTTYDPMTQMELERLAAAMLEKHGVMQILVEHSRGIVPNFACSFRLVVASAHRKAALAAMDEFIDLMKRDVPIWKSSVPAND